MISLFSHHASLIFLGQFIIRQSRISSFPPPFLSLFFLPTLVMFHLFGSQPEPKRRPMRIGIVVFLLVHLNCVVVSRVDLTAFQHIRGKISQEPCQTRSCTSVGNQVVSHKVRHTVTGMEEREREQARGEGRAQAIKAFQDKRKRKEDGTEDAK